ncbi:alkylated DNA repair protein alkB 8 [Dunaliella salina]|uniref:Alkylated DNA repair protein alkB 8 n=1 Tax=Dunaliella salina TaxID=3046 RepID=A0ABQ7H9W6_DUNSA|nr:alkylated DNA repair protein alkB 8 [Dunaliella salina]|eukprot:KAF5843646.1 alkylated DNA repair protein alkB 8 [Dunaliella salina]
MTHLVDSLFGSDSEEEQEGSNEVPPECYPCCRGVEQIPGLYIWKGWLTGEEQDFLLDGIARAGWLAHGNQAMHFGADLPWFLQDVLQKFPASLLPSEVASRRPLFNQMILNRYNPGDGIRPHVDLMRFEDGIAVISLGDSAVMHFSQPEKNPGQSVQVLLEGGDLLVLGGSARWDWHHEIKSVFEEIFNEKRIVRGVRTSITLRRLKEGIILTEAA